MHSSDSERSRDGARTEGPPSPAGRIALALALALLALTLGTWAGVRALGFVDFDDPEYVARNAVVLRGLTAEGLRYAFTTTAMGNWHPLTWLSHMLVAELAGASPGPHHAANLLLHAANVLLVYWLFARTTRSPWPSALAAALFAVHPLHVESVAWVAERKDVLSTTFWLLALHAWVGWARTRLPRWYAATAAAFVAGLMSKPMLVTLPFTLLLVDVWPLGRMRTRTNAAGLSLARLIVEKVPLFALTVVGSALTVFAQRREGAMEFGESLGFALRATNAVRALGVYLLQTIWPARLAAWYPYPEATSWSQVALAAAVVLGISVLAWRAFGCAPAVLVGWLWFLGTLVPVLGLVQVGNQAHADRYTYVPHIGLFAALAWGLAALAADSLALKRIASAVACVAVGACALATARLIPIWRDNTTLFSHALESTPRNSLAHDHLAHMLQLKGESAQAAEHYREVLAIRPESGTAHVNLGTALQQQGDFDGAIASYERAIELDPTLANAWSNLGVVLASRGNNVEAAQRFERAIELAPKRAALLLNAALNDLPLNERARAIERFRRALALDREQVLANPQAPAIAWILSTHPDAALRDGKLAVEICERHLASAGPSELPLREVLAAAYAESGRTDEASAEAERALELARSVGASDVMQRLEQVRELYRSGEPLRLP
jgi:Tfp pilus assembly protein PilF